MANPKPPDPNLEVLWKNVLDDWQDDQRHGAFLEYCESTDQLLEAAVRYKGMAGDRDRGPSAQKRLQGVTLLAMAKLEALRTEQGETRRYAGRLLLIFLFLAASLLLLFYAMT
jgi:hypothetical protein